MKRGHMAFCSNGGAMDGFLELARNYRQCADALLDSALENKEARGYSVLFGYRHALEMYLRIIARLEEPTHSLRVCVDHVGQHSCCARHGKQVAVECATEEGVEWSPRYKIAAAVPRSSFGADVKRVALVARKRYLRRFETYRNHASSPSKFGDHQLYLSAAGWDIISWIC